MIIPFHTLSHKQLIFTNCRNAITLHVNKLSHVQASCQSHFLISDSRNHGFFTGLLFPYPSSWLVPSLLTFLWKPRADKSSTTPGRQRNCNKKAQTKLVIFLIHYLTVQQTAHWLRSLTNTRVAASSQLLAGFLVTMWLQPLLACSEIAFGMLTLLAERTLRCPGLLGLSRMFCINSSTMRLVWRNSRSPLQANWASAPSIISLEYNPRLLQSRHSVNPTD